MKSKYKHMIYSLAVKCLNHGPRCYGVVNRGDKQFLRNYGRELKNGKGMTELERLKWDLENHYKTLPTEWPEFFDKSVETEIP